MEWNEQLNCKWTARSLPCGNCTKWWNRGGGLASFKALLLKTTVQ